MPSVRRASLPSQFLTQDLRVARAHDYPIGDGVTYSSDRRATPWQCHLC